ncbi:MAG: hypothetical protein ACTSRW_13855 [Candidatus Helarchaeota archaeon]
MRKRKNRKLSEKFLQKKIKDLTNLEHVLVLQKGSGIKLFMQSFTSHELFADSYSGLIEAVVAVGERIGTGEKLRRLAYENYQVLIHDGKHVKGVCVMKDNPASNFLFDALTVFIKKFEGRFAGTLMEWNGRLDIFDSTIEILDEAFSTYLIFPICLSWDGNEENLSKLELNILRIARTMPEQYFTIPNLVVEVQKKIKKSELKILTAINDLIDRHFFITSC